MTRVFLNKALLANDIVEQAPNDLLTKSDMQNSNNQEKDKYGLWERVMQHTETSAAYFSLITLRELLRRNSYVERRSISTAGSSGSSDGAS